MKKLLNKTLDFLWIYLKDFKWFRSSGGTDYFKIHSNSLSKPIYQTMWVNKFELIKLIIDNVDFEILSIELYNKKSIALFSDKITKDYIKKIVKENYGKTKT